ncbi:hypothetical protein ACJX0J_025417 [Zea mays]
MWKDLYIFYTLTMSIASQCELGLSGIGRHTRINYSQDYNQPHTTKIYSSLFWIKPYHNIFFLLNRTCLNYKSKYKRDTQNWGFTTNNNNLKSQIITWVVYVNYIILHHHQCS